MGRAPFRGHPWKYRSGVLVTRKVTRTVRRHPPFFVDDVAIPVPLSFIEALCRSLDLDVDAVINWDATN